MSGKITWGHLPVALPDGALIPHLSARFRTQMMDAVFVTLGGHDRMVAWAESNDDNLGKFYGMWARGQARATNVEHSLSDGVEKMLEQLDEAERADNAKVINGTATHVDV